jgi:hypothetical protein
MLSIALTALLLTAVGEPGPKSSGFAGRGLGLKVNGSVAMQSASGSLESRGILLGQWEVGLRLRIGLGSGHDLPPPRELGPGDLRPRAQGEHRNPLSAPARDVLGCRALPS